MIKDFNLNYTAYYCQNRMIISMIKWKWAVPRKFSPKVWLWISVMSLLQSCLVTDQGNHFHDCPVATGDGSPSLYHKHVIMEMIAWLQEGDQGNFPEVSWSPCHNRAIMEMIALLVWEPHVRLLGRGQWRRSQRVHEVEPDACVQNKRQSTDSACFQCFGEIEKEREIQTANCDLSIIKW